MIINISTIIITIYIYLINNIICFAPPDVHRRFEYKLSFKGPHLVFKDGTIPFWEHSGSTIASNDQIRLTPSIKSQKGRIWSKTKLTNNNWEIEVTCRVSGRGRVGADGMAIWFTEEQGVDGPVFGSNDNWKGLGVFLDSFDNDMQQNNPYILVMSNDGTKTYDHDRDGIAQQLGGCLRDFRNKPFPIKLRIEYYKKALTILYHNGMSNDPSGFEICTRVENLDLPQSGYFGVSAATGGLADDHDVLSFLTYSFIDKTETPTDAITDENKKYDKEYQEFLKQLEEEKERYKKEHPEKVEIDEKKEYEVESDRQFRMILDVQNNIHQSIRLLDAKLAEILGRQERIVSLITNPQLYNQPPNNQQQQQGNMLPFDTIKRDEVNLVINQQNELVRQVRELQNTITDVHRKTNVIHDKSNAAQMNNQNANTGVDSSVIQQINDGVKNLRFDIANFQSNTNRQIRCPELPNCLSTFYFMLFVIIQSLLVFVYIVYKNRSENQMKKFY